MEAKKATPEQPPHADICASPKCPNHALREVGYCKKHAYLHGAVHHKASPVMARNHINWLLQTGSTRTGVATASGLSTETVDRILNENTTAIQQRTHNAVLGTPPSRSIQKISTWQLARRIRALRAAGWTVSDIATDSGLSLPTILHIQHERWPTVQRRTAISLRDTYSRLSSLPVKKPHYRVARQGWALPMEWDNIDDPNEHRDRPPLGDDNPGNIDKTRIPVDDQLLAKLRELVAHYGSMAEAARHLGWDGSRVRTYLTGRVKSIQERTYIRIMNHQPEQEDKQ